MKRCIIVLACVCVLSACGNQSGSDSAQANSDSSGNSANSASADTASTSGNTNAGHDNSDNNKSGDFKNKSEKRSYALGMDIGNSLKQLPLKLDLDALTQGVRDVVGGGKTRLTHKQLTSTMQSVVSDMQAAKKKKVAQQSKVNLKKGHQFLAANKKKDGVKTTDDGLQYKVLKKGSGPKPDANDSVTVDYVGKLIDGTVFDSSKKRGQPVTFPVNAVIPGWTEALQLMSQGAEYKLFIPPKLAYGKRGAGSQIGPNETLIFDVHLIKVDKKKGTASKNGQPSTQKPGQNQSQGQGQIQGQGSNQKQGGGDTSNQNLSSGS